MNDARCELSDHRRCEYEAMVKSPGKFEGRHAYVPYFWHECVMDGNVDDTLVDDDGGEVDVIVVRPGDVVIWPELTVNQRIGLRETDDGFVVEVATDGLSHGDFI